MKKIISSMVATSLLLGGCSDMTDNHSTNESQNQKETKSIPEKMPAQEYTGQGFQPDATNEAIKFAKKHRKEFEKVGEQFFKDNFSLNVKATNVVGSGDGVEVFVHCKDNDIVFNSSIVLDKESINQTGSMRSTDTSGDMEMAVGNVLSGFEYRGQKEKYDNLTQFYKDNEQKYNYTGFTKKAINNTQNGGYQNEYYYLAVNLTSIQNYRKYYEPLIHKNDREFKLGLEKAKYELNNQGKNDVVSTLFSTQKDPSKKELFKSVYTMANNIENNKNMPKKTRITTQLGDKYISTKKAFYTEKDTADYGSFDEE